MWSLALELWPVVALLGPVMIHHHRRQNVEDFIAAAGPNRKHDSPCSLLALLPYYNLLSPCLPSFCADTFSHSYGH